MFHHHVDCMPFVRVTLFSVHAYLLLRHFSLELSVDFLFLVCSACLCIVFATSAKIWFGVEVVISLQTVGPHAVPSSVKNNTHTAILPRSLREPSLRQIYF